MKKITISALIIALFTLSITSNVSYANQPKKCEIPGDEALVCEVIMCAVGINIPASAAECVKVNFKFAKYLATLGFWSKPPSCKTKDKDCNDVGKQEAPLDSNYCDSLGTIEDQESCKAATGDVTAEYCATLTGQNKIDCEKLVPKN